MTKSSNLKAIEEATGRPWGEWVSLLDKTGGRELKHRQIADIVVRELEGHTESAGWWSQSVTVAYEQHIGRRAPGQQTDGSYEVSVTKRIPGTKRDVIALWNEAYGSAKAFSGRPIENIRKTVTPVRSYWRCDFVDGSRLAIAVEQKTPEQALISATHTKLASASDKDNWQRFWRETLNKL